MHQEPQNGNNYPQNNQVPQNQSANRYTYNNLVNIQHPSTTRSAVSSRSGNIYGNVSQVTTPATVAPVKTPFSVVKGITQSTTSSHNPSSTVQHFASPNKKITIPNIVKPPQTMQIQKIKLEVKEEVVEEDPLLLREKILQLYYDSVEEIKCNFKEKLQELFFVQSGGNMVDYPAWKQRPNPHLLSFLNIYRLDDTTTLSTPTATNTVSPSIKMQAAYTPAGSGTTSQHSTPHLGIPNVRFSSFPEINKILPQTAASSVGQYGFVQGVHSPQVDTVRKTSIQSVNVTPVKQEPVTINKDSSAVSKANDVSKIAFTTPTQPTPPPSTPNSSTSQDEILGQVRHESDIVQRISRLRKSGLWSASRLPKVYEQPRKKSQWDFLLEEMQWLATDFTQEKKWKRSMAKKISRSVMKFHQDKQAFQRKMKKEETARLKRVAGGIAKEVKSFWRQIEKVACYKQQSRQEEQRRKALDLHLNFIVGQTEKYSSWLAEGMKDSSISSAVSSRQVSDGDDNFEPDEKDAEDDEETIAEEENTSGDGKEKYQEELEALKEDSEMPIEELLKTLPSDMLARISGEGPSQSGDEGNMGEGESESDGDESSSESDVSVGGGEKDDEENVGDGGEEKKSDKAKSFDQSGVENNDNESGEEYVANEQEMQDDEQTIDEEEALGEVDHKEEIDALQNEAEMPIEELRKMYGMSTDSVPPPSDSESDTCDEVDSDLNSLTGDESDTNLMTNLTSELDVKKTSESTAAPETEEASVEKSLPNQQLTDAAATAESLQPKGFTLSTTQVKTKVPFLLHHTLREYQHIGLDWLVTMYQKQLNGILADEMGLGKTIQTIALLAHLACEEEIWGPHLIVVPTSVILNWEFEFKKWCPGFKILTYFGTQKERKMKRSGWMKPNAFHVCITSYNLVLQDHQAFRRRKWKYLILDEAQNIKNFKSQRWQMLLNFHSQRRLLLTGTPLQNHLMELWSLMHFLMPNIFTSHQDFKEWFANPLTGMIEGSTEYNEGIIKRLHTVLRPFLLRRLKSEVELQMPKKYEHVMKCRLSKRQRFLYDEFMSRTKTKETLEAGNFLSVINILMQLRKVCNHPDLFELRPTISPFVMDRLVYESPFLVNDVLPNEPPLGTCLSNYEQTMCAFQAHRTRQLKVPRHILKNLYNSNIDSSSVESNEPYLQNEISSSQFQPLSNVSGEVLSGHPGEAELTRSYFDCLTSSPSTAGYATIGDILTRQIEQSLECTNDIDVVNVDEESDELYCPVTKKQKMNESNSNNNSNNSNNSNNDKNKNEDKNNTSSCNLKLGHLLEDYMAEEVSPFHLNSLKEKTEEQRSSRLNYGALMNERHCDVSPVYGLDLHHAVKVCTCPSSRFVGALMHQYKRNNYSDVLSDVIKSPGRRLRERKSISDRYLLYIYPVLSSTIVLKSSHVVPSRELERKRLKCNLESLSFKKFDILSPMVAHIRLQFPETRLVQYDCGKLQTLDYLLHRLKFNKHRVLIFTQMTRMLDVLERFLNYHGFIYLRLDGSTKVDQRQMLMERFNHDQKIFVFILSTRSGGIGVNLTGADTVIFYDSDWNPTMDAQAQDRCHRIGQTRDVHIYRLISERTVEENILKKAQNKRLLGDIAIEGGNFTASYFKQQSIKELFDTNEESIEDKTTVVVSTKTTESASSATPAAKKEAIKGNQFEEVLAEVEEEDDVKASRRAKIEQDSELAEFNENAPVGDNADESKVEKALATLQNELKPIERFALKFMEETHSFHVEDEVEETEKMLEAKKKEWELDHLQSIKEAEEKKHAEEDDDMFFTYARDDTYSKHFIDDYSGVLMPVWTPPTPPREGSVDLVTDPCLAFLYETPTIPENHLPPTHCLRKNGMDLYAMKRNTSRTHYLGIFKKKRHRLSRPKSIFDKKALEILNKNKLKKSQKLKQKAALAVTPVTTAAAPTTVAPVTVRTDSSQDIDDMWKGKDKQGADWMISEDWTLLQAINILSELPLDFQSEAVNNKLANWELASDVVNIASRIHRSSKQCRDRYQNVVVPREEGKLLTNIHSDSLDGKIKKNKKNIHHVPLAKNAAVAQQKTHLQFNQDHGKSVVSMHYAKFDSVKMSAVKRKPTVKQPNSNKILGSSRHTQILTANGIAADKPLNPRELATMRAERIAKEKAQAVVAAQQLQQHQTSTTTSTSTSQVQVSLVLTSRATLAQPANISVAGVGSIQKGATAGIIQAQNRGNLVFTSAGTAISSGSSSLVVNPSVTSTPTGLTTTAASFAAINRKMQNVSQNAVSLGQLPIVSATGATRILGTQTICQSTQMLPGLVQSKLTNQTSNSFTVAVSSVSSVVAPNLVTQVQRGATIAGTVVNPGKTLNQHHIALLRQKAQQQQQQQQQQLQKIQQQRIQQQKQQQQQQLKLLQQQQQQQQQQPQTQTSQSPQQSPAQTQAQTSKQVQPTLVATTNQLGTLTVQTMKAPVTLRGSVPQQIAPQGLTQAQQQQLVQQALKKQQYQQLQRGQSQIQQMLAGQKLTQHQLQQLQQQQQQQRQTQLQQQQQLKFQQQVTATIVTQPKTQLVMTQVKPGQSVQSLKTSGQQIQLQQIQQTGSIQTSLPQQILLRPTLPQGTGQAQFQGLPQQIQLRAMISQQSAQQMQRVNAGQQLQAMQAQVNLQTGTVVMQPQPTSQSGTQQQLSTAQVHVVSSLAQQQQRNIQAAVQKQVQQQHQTQLKVTSVSTGTTKSAQVQLQFQQPSQQLRHQVLSATPAQLSQVKAFVSQAQLQASLSRSNSPVGSGITSQSTTPNSIVPQNLSSSQVTSIQLQAQQVSQQIRSQAQMVQVQLKTSTSEALSTHQSQQQTKQQQLKQQLQQLQSQAAKQQQQQQLRQPSLTAGSPSVIPQRSETPKIPESPLSKTDIQMEVETLGAETELSVDGNQEKDGDESNLQG